MRRRGGAGGIGNHGAAGGAGSKRDRGGKDGEGKLRIHLKRSCTNRKLVQQGHTELGLTTDDWHKFKKLLESKTFVTHDTKRIRGDELTAAWAEESGFRDPVIATDKTGSGLEVPDSSFTVADVARVVGEDKAVRPIHVGEQANIDQSMTLAEFAEYFETCTKPGQAILNIISLEFSDTPLAEMVQSPQLVRDVDWLNRCWPADRKQEGQFPKVQFYCLMSQGGSYTDFHVDFGGTSVWYHILRGKKEFLLVRPTNQNLELYEAWIRSPTQSQVFFGDLADTCYRLVLNAGETLMIPSGWIHAVFTPKPSIVFGGNFLHSLNIPMQLQIHGIEDRAKTAAKFRFPYFKEMMFFAAAAFVNKLRSHQGPLARGEQISSSLGHGATKQEGGEESTLETDGNGEAAEAAGAAAEALQVNEGAAGGALATGTSGEEAPEEKGAGNGAGNGVGNGTGNIIGNSGGNDPANDAGNDGRNDPGTGVVVSLSSWEREGLRPLLEACRAWLKAEEVDYDEADVPEEWHQAAAIAGCAGVGEMLAELDLRVSALGEITSVIKATVDVSSPSAARTADAAAAATTTTRTGGIGTTMPPLAGNCGNIGQDKTAIFTSAPSISTSSIGSSSTSSSSSSTSRGELEDSTQDGPTASAASGGTASLLLAAAAAASLDEEAAGAETTPALDPAQAPTVAAVHDHNGGFPSAAAAAAAVEATTASGRESGAGAAGGGGAWSGENRRPITSLNFLGPSSAEAASSYTIPKLKLSIKPQQQSSGVRAIAGADSREPAAGSGGKPRAGLKLFLKGPALSSAGGGGEGAGDVGTGGCGGAAAPVDGAGEKRGRQKQPPWQQQKQQHKRRWREGYEDSDESETAIGSGDDVDEEDEDEDEEREESEDEGRIGRGGKRKARPLGSRLRAIARLGEDAAAAGSEDDDSADEYKPEDADDEVLPGDHKLYADELPRESKKRKPSSSAGGGGGGSGSRTGNAWRGFGSSARAAESARGSGGGGFGCGGGGAGEKGRGTGVIAGMRRISVTKQEALRSKGLFKIAPQSKVPAKPSGKYKKPLTAKQKLLAKMRR